MKIHRIINSDHYRRVFGGSPAPDHPAMGMEIEVENVSNFHVQFKHWVATTDGSLRDNGIEFISNGPIKFTDVKPAILEYIKNAASQEGYTHGYRTSFHVHLNVAPLTVAQFWRLLHIYLLLERGMYLMGGEWRRMSPYCVPVCDVPYIFDTIVEFTTKEPNAREYINFVSKLKTGDMKYCGLGTFRIADLCTLEFRMHEGTNDEERMVMFTDVIRGMYDAAITNTDVYQCANDIINKLIPCDLVDATRKGFEQAKFEIDMLPCAGKMSIKSRDRFRWGRQSPGVSWGELRDSDMPEALTTPARSMGGGDPLVEVLFDDSARQLQGTQRAPEPITTSDVEEMLRVNRRTRDRQEEFRRTMTPAYTTAQTAAGVTVTTGPAAREEYTPEQIRHYAESLDDDQTLTAREKVNAIISVLPTSVARGLGFDEARIRSHANGILRSAGSRTSRRAADRMFAELNVSDNNNGNG